MNHEVMAYAELSRRWGNSYWQNLNLINEFRLEYPNEKQFLENSNDIKKNIKLGIIEKMFSLNKMNNIDTTIDNMDKQLQNYPDQQMKEHLQRLTLNSYNKLLQLYREVRNY